MIAENKRSSTSNFEGDSQGVSERKMMSEKCSRQIKDKDKSMALKGSHFLYTERIVYLQSALSDTQ